MKLRDDTRLRLLDEEIQQLEDRQRECLAKRSRIYLTVQDMTVSANKTDMAISKMKEVNTEISKLKSQIKRKTNERTRAIKEAGS